MSDYFTDQINTGQPIVPPVTQADTQKPLEIPKPPANLTATEAQSEWVGLPVRAAGDRIFLLKGGKKSWIMNPNAYAKLGFNFGDEVKIDQATLDVIPEGEPING